MSYDVRPVRSTTDSLTDMEVCTLEEAEIFSVYYRGKNGMSNWIADFRDHEDAEAFKQLKELTS